MPTRSQWPGFRLAVSHHATSEQIRVVEHRAACVHNRITELSTFVDGAGSFRRSVARNSSRKRKLLEQLLDALFVLRDVRIKLAVGALEIRIRDHSRPAVPGTSKVDGVQIVVLNQAIEMGVDEVQSRRRPPVPKESRLDVLDLQRFAEKRIGVQINLAYGKIVGRAPVRVKLAQFFRRERLGGNAMLRGVYRGWGSHSILPFYFKLFPILISWRRIRQHPKRRASQITTFVLETSRNSM